MTILSIKTIPNPILRVKSVKVDSSNMRENFWNFIDDMKETARANNLVGLSANQVGIPQRVFIIDMFAGNRIEGEEEDKKYNFREFINPVFKERASIIKLGEEGCASIPNLIRGVKRFEEVEIDCLFNGKIQETFILSDYLARIAQHEMDHLDGILFTDRTNMIWKKEKE